MPEFGRRTIIAAVSTIERWYHADIDRFLLEHTREDELRTGSGDSKRARANDLIRHLVRNPEREAAEGGNLTDMVVRDLIARATESSGDSFQEAMPELSRALKRDGFEVVNGQLRRTLPEALNLPASDDEVHTLLQQFDFVVPLGHLDQAISNHTSGNWAAANGQLRSFVEALMDSIAERLELDTSKLPSGGWARVEWLANRTPPFFLRELNEWQTDSKSGRPIGFIYGIWQRLHPQGSHPGLSDEDDATFRLHVVLLLARLLLRRLRGRTS